ncbi:hypothetical protein KR038_003781 [Drosophila bunnanda]|nr:hypothetical protein KR038_003781 [Drosophila bunnanda]
MAPALTAEPLSPKEKLTSTASPSARSSSLDSGTVAGGGTGGIGPGSVTKKPSTPTPATATTRVTRSREAAAVAAAAAAAAAGASASSPAATIPPLRSSQPNNKRKSGGNKPSNEPAMGLSTAPTPHSSSSSASAGSSTPDAATASTSATPAVVEQNNNSSTTHTHSSSPKDNSTAQLLADLRSAEICLRKTLPEVSLGKEPATTPAAATSSSSTTESPGGGGGDAAADDQSIPVEEELSKIETDNIEERLSQLDGNAVAMPEELPPPPREPEPPTTPSRQQQTPVNQPHESPRLQATQQLQQQQLTPQSNAGSINFLKDVAAGAVLEDQDIEEVLKALKTFDGAHVNPDAICDFFDDVWEEAAPAPSMTTTAAPVSIVPELPDIKPGFSGSGILPSSSSLSTASASAKPERSWQESHAELEQQQHLISRRIEFLLRRMRKYQARQMCRHASGEVAGILEWSARSSHKTPNPARSATLSEREATVLSIVSGRPDTAFWEEQKKHPLPASQMSSVIRHIGTAARHQQICHAATGTSATLAPSSSWFNSANSTTLPGKRPRKNQLDSTTGAGAAAATTAAAAVSLTASGAVAAAAAAGTTGSTTDSQTPRADDIVPGYDTYVTSELTHVAGLLHTELREVQNAIDSDATESSSGGESADEMVTYNNTQQLSLPITRRAVWRYSKDRAAIALRWSWLCSQLGDLEMKIRQYSDLYVELSQSKGEVQLEATASQSPLTFPANGLKEEPPSDWLCSRARPLVLSEFRKRKLFQTTNMHTISKKAARPSNIKCGCQWPQVPCTLCTGRADPTAPRELIETMMPANRVALIDAGFHPVLSFASDVTQSVHLEAVARQPDWQYRVMRCQAKAIVKAMRKAERETLASGGSGGHAGSRRSGDAVKRRYIRRKERNNNSNKEAGSGASAAGGGGGSGVGGGDSGNGTGTATTTSSTTPTTTPLVANTAAAGRKQHQQHPTGVNNSRSQWPDSRQRQRQLHHSPSSTSISAHSGAKKSRKSTTNNNSSSCNSIQQQHTPGSNINNHHLNGYGDQWGSEQSTSRSRRNSSPTHSHRNERTSERRIRPIYDIDNIVIPYSMAAQTRVEILPYKEIPTPKWRIVDSDSDKAKQSADESAECKLSNGSVPATATSDEQLSNTQTDAQGSTQEQQPPDEQPPKVNGLRQKEAVVKHNNNNIINNNNNNNKNGLVNGNAKKAEPKTAKQHKVDKKEEKGKKPKLNGNIGKNQNAKTAEKLTESTAEIEPPLPKRSKLEKSEDEVTKTKANGQAPAPFVEMEEEEYIEEDLSDEAFIARHQRALLEERRRFETFLKFPWSTRSRANRRADSRAESSGANTPDPASPAPHHGGAGLDNESIPSPLAHPLEGFNESGELITGGQSRQARRRTTSSKLKDQTERRSTTPDLREVNQEICALTRTSRMISNNLFFCEQGHALIPQPSVFEPLIFPLSEEVYQRLLAETYATPTSMSSTKRAKTKSVSSNCDGSSFTGGGGSGSSRRSSKSKTKLNNGQLNGQINGHPMAAKIDTIEDDDERVLVEGDGGISEPEEEDVLLEEEDDDYPKHHLAPLDDEQESTPDAELNLYDSAIDAYLGDQEALEEDMAEDPFEDDDPNDPEWKNRTDGSRSRRT